MCRTWCGFAAVCLTLTIANNSGEHNTRSAVNQLTMMARCDLFIYVCVERGRAPRGARTGLPRLPRCSCHNSFFILVTLILGIMKKTGITTIYNTFTANTIIFIDSRETIRRARAFSCAHVLRPDATCVWMQRSISRQRIAARAAAGGQRPAGSGRRAAVA